MPEGDGLRLYDRGAHNGTYVKLVAAEPLSDGDEFRLANSRFRYLTREVSRSTEAEVEEAEPPDQTIIAIAAAPETSPAPESQPDEQPRRGGLAARLRSQRRNSSEKEQEPVSPFVPAEEATVLSFDLAPKKYFS